MKVKPLIEKVSFSVKGQIVIPRALREEYAIEADTRAYVQATPEGILIKQITKKFIGEMCGKYKHLKLMETLQEMKREEKKF